MEVISEVDKDDDEVNPDITRKMKKLMFMVEQKPLAFVRARGNYIMEPIEKIPPHM